MGLSHKKVRPVGDLQPWEESFPLKIDATLTTYLNAKAPKYQSDKTQIHELRDALHALPVCYYSGTDSPNPGVDTFTFRMAAADEKPDGMIFAGECGTSYGNSMEKFFVVTVRLNGQLNFRVETANAAALAQFDNVVADGVGGVKKRTAGSPNFEHKVVSRGAETNPRTSAKTVRVWKQTIWPLA